MALYDPERDKRLKAQEARDKKKFIEEAKKAGFTENQAKFMWKWQKNILMDVRLSNHSPLIG
jgi:hypothetical protein